MVTGVPEPKQGSSTIPTPTPPPAPILVATRAQIPAVDAQPTASGRFMSVGPVVNEGVLVGYGDYGANTGPIDVIAVSPTGVVTTLLAKFDTEEIIAMRKLAGAVYIPAVDPKSNTSAQIATNYGGTWHTITAQPPGVGVAIHLFDVMLDPANGNLLACGSRGPDTAFVWRSADQGVTWTEDLAHNADGGGYNRFYEFKHVNGAPVVVTTHGTPAYYRLVDSVWTQASGPFTFDPNPVVGVQADGRRWSTDGNNLYLTP